MTRARLATSLLAIAVVSPVDAAQIAPGEVAVAVIRNSQAIAGLGVVVDGKPVGTTDAAGRLTFMSTSGPHRVVIMEGSKTVAFSEFRLTDNDAAEISVTLAADNSDPKVERDVFDTRSAPVAEIRGTVLDAGGKGLSGVAVSAADTSASTTTDASGAFLLRLPRGEYTVNVAPAGAEAQSLKGVRASPLLGGNLAVTIAAAAPAPAAAPAAGGAAALGTVTVKGVVKRQSSTQKERIATSVVDTISSEEISAAGDSNAADAIRRVTGVSVQNKVVVVRGLGDRYSTTLVNGAEIPSFNPSRRVVAVDAFPSEFLGGLTVQKTYSADLPGEFSGGVALIETKPTPDFETAAVRFNLGGNTQTTLSPVLTYRGSATDWLGTDGGRRDLPDAYRQITNNGATTLGQASADDRLLLLQSLPNVFDLRRIDDAPADFGGSLTYGDVYKLGGQQKLGFQVTGLYDQNFRFRREERAVYTGIGDGITVSRQDNEELQRSEQTFETGGTLGLGYEYNKRHKVDFLTLLTRQTEKGAFFARANASDAGFATQQERVTLDFIESQLISNQLTGKHKFMDLAGLSLKWQGGYSVADRDVLDRRSYGRQRAAGTDDPFLIGFGQSGEASEPRRTWEFLQDRTLDFGADASLPFELGETIRGDIKAGGRITRRERDFESVRFAYSAPANQRSDLFRLAQFFPSVESILIPLFYGQGTGFDLTDLNISISGGGNANFYTGAQDVDAFYLLGDVFLGDALEVQVGARFEKSLIDVSTGDPRAGATVDSRLNDTDILPSLNATWFVSRQQQVRLGVSQSVNRPQFRELAEVDFLDPETRFFTIGNSQLKSAKLTNYDLRFEQYWSNSKAASIGVFYKDIQDPIEFNINAQAGNQVVRSFQNANSARDYGIEIDFRYDFSVLERVAPVLQYTFVSGNFSRIESEVKLPGGGTRQLQGQSNYLINTTLGYSNPVSRTEATLLFNIFGDRLAEIGINDLPNAVEKSYPILDFNLRQGIGTHWQVGVKARNLLNPRIDIVQGVFNNEAAIQRGYKLGRSGAISVEYKF